MNSIRYAADRERHGKGARQSARLPERNNSKIGKCEKPQNKQTQACAGKQRTHWKQKAER